MSAAPHSDPHRPATAAGAAALLLTVAIIEIVNATYLGIMSTGDTDLAANPLATVALGSAMIGSAFAVILIVAMVLLAAGRRLPGTMAAVCGALYGCHAAISAMIVGTADPWTESPAMTREQWSRAADSLRPLPDWYATARIGSCVAALLLVVSAGVLLRLSVSSHRRGTTGGIPTASTRDVGSARRNATR